MKQEESSQGCRQSYYDHRRAYAGPEIAVPVEGLSGTFLPKVLIRRILSTR